MKASSKKRLYFSIILFSVSLGLIAIALLYFLNWEIIKDSYNTYEGSFGVVLIISLRIIIVSGMAFYTFYKWFKQEQQYFTDLPFLFGLFFTFLVFGKFLDMFSNFIYFQLNESIVLLVLKMRYLIMIFDFFPMIYLSFEMILFSFSLKTRFKRLTNEKERNKTGMKFIILILIVFGIALGCLYIWINRKRTKN